MEFYKEMDFQKTEIGKIPKEWECVKIGDPEYSILLTGGTPSTKKKEYWNGTVPWMASGDIHQKYIKDVPGKISKEGLNNSAAKYIPINSVLVALNGQGKTKGTVAINLIELTCNQSIAAYDLNKDEFNPFFIFHYLTSQYIELRSMASNNDRAGLNLRLLRSVIAPKPSLAEQIQISSILSRIDVAIQKTEEIIQKTQLLKKGLMQELLTKGIGHTEFKYSEKLGCEIPKEWTEKELGNIVDIKNGQRPSIIGEGSIPVYGANGIMGYTSACIIESDLIILIGRVGASGEVNYTKGKAWVSDNAFYTSRFNREEVNPLFIYYLLKFKQLSRYAKKSTHPIISLSFLRSFPLEVPSLEEQEKIASILSKVDDQIEKERQTKKELEKLKKGLMQILLTGKVRVKVN